MNASLNLRLALENPVLRLNERGNFKETFRETSAYSPKISKYS